MLQIIDMLHLPTNKVCYGIVDEDDFSKEYDVYKTKEQAQCMIELLIKTGSQQQKKNAN